MIENTPVGRTYAPPAPSWRPERISRVFETCYDAIPLERRPIMNGAMEVLRVEQDTHEKIIPGVPEIVFRLLAKGSSSRSKVERGEVETRLSGRVGGIYIAPADQEARWRAEGRHEVVMLAAPQNALLEILGSDGFETVLGLAGREFYNANVASTMSAIWRESDRSDPLSELMVQGLLLTFLAEIAKGAGTAGDEPSAVVEAPLTETVIAKVASFIDAKIDDQLSLDDLASVANLSPFHFSRRFRAATGTSPHRYLLSRRVEAARRMLEEELDGVPLAEIAFRCGFSSQSHLTRAFKSALGVTPGNFRANREG